MEKDRTELEQIEAQKEISRRSLETTYDPNEVARSRSRQLEKSSVSPDDKVQVNDGKIAKGDGFEETHKDKEAVELSGTTNRQGIEKREALISRLEGTLDKENKEWMKNQMKGLGEGGDISELRRQRNELPRKNEIQQAILERIESVPEGERRRIELDRANFVSGDVNEIAERRKKDIDESRNSDEVGVRRNVWAGVPEFEKLAEVNVNKELEGRHLGHFKEFDEKVRIGKFEYDKNMGYVKPERIMMPVHDSNEDFWNRKGNTSDTYERFGERYDDIRTWQKNGGDLDVLNQDPELSNAVKFWLNERPVKLTEYKDSFRVEEDGRHRVAVAKLYGHNELLAPASIENAKEKTNK